MSSLKTSQRSREEEDFVLFCLGLDHVPDPVQKQFSPHGGEGGKWGGGGGGTREEQVQGEGTWSTLRSAGEGRSVGGSLALEITSCWCE